MNKFSSLAVQDSSEESDGIGDGKVSTKHGHGEQRKSKVSSGGTEKKKSRRRKKKNVIRISIYSRAFIANASSF